MSFGRGAEQFLGGLFGNSGRPYERYGDELSKYFNQGMGYQQPFFEAGKGAIPGYNEWLGKMKDPSQFINGLMGQYQESPWAKYQQDQAMRAGTNAASAGGLLGSTPFAQEMARTSAGISSQDMNQWLQSVLGINNQYGAGLAGEMGMGQNSANSLSDMLARLGIGMGQAGFGEEAGKQQDWGNIIGGALGMFGL